MLCINQRACDLHEFQVGGERLLEFGFCGDYIALERGRHAHGVYADSHIFKWH